MKPHAAINLLIAAVLSTLTAPAAETPNIVVILTDDQGYADISFNPQHKKEVSTPHMDALAREGVWFSHAYTSGSVCSPTRAGLMLGRYQQRVGVYTAGDGGRGFDPRIPIFPRFLPKEYRSTVIGKWHMGLDTDYPQLKYHALNRGFDACYKFMGRGGHDYFTSGGVNGGENPIYRNQERTAHTGYLTDVLSREAVAFIDRNKDQPFFLYLAYNAVHAPKQAPKETIAKYKKQFPGLGPDRHVLMAMLEHLDRGVGSVVKKLKEEDLFANTLLFFLTDNGGAKNMRADNAPLKGFKGSLSEGGIRTPFVVSWPDRFAGGRRIDTPVISLDILPTALDAVRAPTPEDQENRFDGKSLLPIIEGKTEGHHKNLFWSEGGLSGEWAVRQGDWKLHTDKTRKQLYNLSEDPAETRNLAGQKTDRVEQLTRLYDQWLKPMAKPIGGHGKRWAETESGAEPDKRDRRLQREERRRQREAQRKKNTSRNSDSRPKQPNVLFVICDDLNRHVSTSGYTPIQTPALAMLASESLTFTRSYCQYPVCGPSRASFLSGLYPESTGVLDNKSNIAQKRPGAVSMPQHFRQNGYWTAGTGKIFHKPGFAPDEAWDAATFFQNDELPLIKEARRKFEAEHGSIEKRSNRRLWNQTRRKAGGRLTSQTPPGHGPSGLEDAQHRDGKNVRQILTWLKDREYGEKPFFIMCGIHKPHVPFLAPQKYFDLYPREKIRYLPNPIDDWNDIPRLALVKRAVAFGFDFGKENDALRREYMQAYHACISFVDAQLALLFDGLKQAGHWDDTVIVFTSDHGYHLGEHYLWGKVSLFEECARAPLIVRVPGLTPAGDSTGALVEHVDFFPTLLEVCGLKPKPGSEGRSFAGVLAQPDRPGREDVYTVVSRGQKLGRSIRTQRWRYAEWGSPDAIELYDLKADPRELTNLAEGEAHAEVLAEMKRRLADRRIGSSSGSR